MSKKSTPSPKEPEISTVRLPVVEFNALPTERQAVILESKPQQDPETGDFLLEVLVDDSSPKELGDETGG